MFFRKRPALRQAAPLPIEYDKKARPNMNPLTPRKFQRYLRAALPLLALGGGAASARSASTGRRQQAAVVSHQGPQGGDTGANPFAGFGDSRETRRETDAPAKSLAQLVGNDALKPSRELAGRATGDWAGGGNRFAVWCSTFSPCISGGACVASSCVAPPPLLPSPPPPTMPAPTLSW